MRPYAGGEPLDLRGIHLSDYLARPQSRRPLDVRLRQWLISHVAAVNVALLALALVGLGLATDWQAARVIAAWVVGR